MSETEAFRSERLDHYVVRQMPDLSRSSVARLIEGGKVLVNGKPLLKPSYRTRPADKIDIQYEAAKANQIPDIKIPILYEDEDCVVINKPLGVLTHSKGAFNPEATVATWLKSRLASGMEGERAGIVHRLDRATSGVMICAKTPEALSWLQKQFSQRKVKKVYLAVIEGTPKKEHAIIDMPIERNPRKPQTFRVGSNGKQAITEYKVLKTSSNSSLIELRPLTGRTHQLRVHMQHLGHPIYGDTLYGKGGGDKLFLHAQSLEITLLGRERKIFTAPLPDRSERWHFPKPWD